MPINTQAVHRQALCHVWKKAAIWPPANGLSSASPTADLTVLEDKRGEGKEGRPITSSAQPGDVIGIHVLVHAFVWNCRWKDNWLNHELCQRDIQGFPQTRLWYSASLCSLSATELNIVCLYILNIQRYRYYNVINCMNPFFFKS